MHVAGEHPARKLANDGGSAAYDCRRSKGSGLDSVSGSGCMSGNGLSVIEH